MLTLSLWLLLQQEGIHSGPQKGEKASSFTVYDVSGPNKGKEFDYVKEWKGAPTLLVFIHELTRPAAQCFRPLDDFAAKKRDRGLKALFVVLTEDQDGSERRLPTVVKSLSMKSIVSVSVDGLEGPGSYGLNKKVTMTVLVVKDGVVTANFAILSPNETDAPKILKELEAILPRDPVEPKLDTPEEMRAEIRRLREEIRQMREEMEALRRDAARKPERKMDGDLPGKAPEDPKLVAFLRRLINPESAEKDIDAAVQEIEECVKGDEKLRKQMAGGLVRVLHLKYGTDYARRKMDELRKRLEK